MEEWLYKGQGNVCFSIDLGGMTLRKSQFLQELQD